MFSLDELGRAEAIVHAALPPTPAIAWPLIARRLGADWQHKYGHPIYLLETFVDTSRFPGTCYQAANWQCVGQTTGRTRQNKSMIPQAAPKAVWLYPLRPDFRQALCAP